MISANDIQSDNRKFRSRLLVGKNCTTLYGDGCWTLVWLVSRGQTLRAAGRGRRKKGEEEKGGGEKEEGSGDSEQDVVTSANMAAEPIRLQ